MKNFVWTIAGIILLFTFTSARATIVNLDANLDGLQEVPPNVSPAFGLGDFKLDESTNQISVTLGNYQDLLGGSTQITLNDGAAGVSGALISLLTVDTPGSNTGTFSGTAITLTPSQVTDALAGNLYVNVRSNVFPSGEIRGQLSVVPEPGTLGLLAGGGLMAMRRRRK